MDHELLRTWLDDEAVMEFPYAFGDMPARYEGVDAILSAMSIISQMFVSFTLTPVNFYSSPDTNSMIVEAVSNGVRSNGSDYDNRYIILFSFKGEKVVMWREFFNPLKLPEAVTDNNS